MFSVPVWNPYLKKDIEKLEKIQHKATKLVRKIINKCYEDRLGEMKLTTLETRRKRGDLIQFFKILNGRDQVKWKNKIEKTLQKNENGPAASNLRKKGTCFHRESAKTCTVRDNFFLNKVIPLWNPLPQHIKEAKTLKSFKARLDKEELFLI